MEHIYEGKKELSSKEKLAVEYGIRDMEEGDILYHYTIWTAIPFFPHAEKR